jgi:hypothetical protein
VDFKLENVLVSLHSLKSMGLGSIIKKKAAAKPKAKKTPKKK